MLAYVLLLTQNAFYTPTILSLSFPETTISARARWFKEQADTYFFAMAFGATKMTQERQEQTRQNYGQAATLEDELYGRGNAQGQVHHKLYERFNRYFELTCEAAEGAMQGLPSSKKSQSGLILSRNTHIDYLLEQLTRATTSLEKERIIAQLKKL